jgi:hypothetical protein
MFGIQKLFWVHHSNEKKNEFLSFEVRISCFLLTRKNIQYKIDLLITILINQNKEYSKYHYQSELDLIKGNDD